MRTTRHTQVAFICLALMASIFSTRGDILFLVNWRLCLVQLMQIDYVMTSRGDLANLI